MREICFILPHRSALSGITLPGVHDEFRDHCVAIAGGVTIVNAEGRWRNGNQEPISEPVAVYTVACSDSGYIADLCDHALNAGRALAQQCIYFRDSAGTVHLLEC